MAPSVCVLDVTSWTERSIWPGAAVNGDVNLIYVKLPDYDLALFPWYSVNSPPQIDELEMLRCRTKQIKRDEKYSQDIMLIQRES